MIAKTQERILQNKLKKGGKGVQAEEEVKQEIMAEDAEGAF